MSKIIEDFLVDYLKKEPLMNKEGLVEILSKVEMIIRQNEDKSLEEIIELLIQDMVLDLEDVRKKYGVPGYTTSIKVGNIHVKLYGGNINYLGEPLKENALFDIASMSKFYTQIVAYNLMKEGLFSRDDKIKDLDSRFVNLDDLTVDDILTFGVSFRTDGLIKDKKTIDEALNTLYTTRVVTKGAFNYNDIGLMIMKEVMESLSGLTYPELVDKYIIKPLHLEDTYIIVPNCKFKLLTGTPNFNLGHINDMSANAVGGYSGHAGVFASSDDLVKLMDGVRYGKILPNMEDAYRTGKWHDAHAVIGSNYSSRPKDLRDTFVESFEPIDTFAISGSTRVNATSMFDGTWNVLFNPSSMDINEAKDKVRLINEKRIQEGKSVIEPVKEYEFTRDGKLVKYTLIDPRQLLPIDIMEKMTKKVATKTLELRLLDFMMKESVKVVKNIK